MIKPKHYAFVIINFFGKTLSQSSGYKPTTVYTHKVQVYLFPGETELWDTDRQSLQFNVSLN